MNQEKNNKVDISSEKTVIEIINMHKWYGDFHVLNDINLNVKKRERIVVCGPSGSGSIRMHSDWNTGHSRSGPISGQQ